MRQLLLVAQVGFLTGVVAWIAAGTGCGAKSSLLVDGEHDESTDPDVIPPPPVPCEEDSDCDDGEWCNGLEMCIDNFCEDGEAIDCGEGDICTMVYCDEDRDQCIDMDISEDLDGDEHFAAPCGADCNDTNPEIYPGAREQCNGVDDDCDGEIDEELFQECEDFGRRRCVDGEWTECLTCTVCIPGAVRFCDTPSYCSNGQQRCNDAGDGWSDCYESGPPPGCAGYYYDEACCIESGACCQDFFDVDNDGDRDESLGHCEDVVCPGAD